MGTVGAAAGKPPEQRVGIEVEYVEAEQKRAGAKLLNRGLMDLAVEREVEGGKGLLRIESAFVDSAGKLLAVAAFDFVGKKHQQEVCVVPALACRLVEALCEDILHTVVFGSFIGERTSAGGEQAFGAVLTLKSSEVLGRDASRLLPHGRRLPRPIVRPAHR